MTSGRSVKTDHSICCRPSLKISQGANALFFNTRIVRTAEMLMYLSRLYGGLNVPRNTTVNLYPSPCRACWKTYIGHKQPSDDSVLPIRQVKKKSSQQSLPTFQLLDESLPQHVQNLLDPVFTLFDFFQPGRESYDQIVTDFKQGKVT